MSYDLPCRLIYILGAPCGGSGAFAGTLAANEYWHTKHSIAPCWETPEASKITNLVPDQFSLLPSRSIIPTDVYWAGRFFYDAKKQAIAQGKSKAVMKTAGSMLFQIELLGENSLGVVVEPVLVWREPKSCAASIVFWHSLEANRAEDIAAKSMEQIEKLHQQKKWPLWRFGIDGHNEIERVVGETFPNVWLNPSVVRH